MIRRINSYSMLHPGREGIYNKQKKKQKKKEDGNQNNKRRNQCTNIH